jgi:TonB dependent receptor/TonB-dependent Receptor Plug Domain
MKKLSQGIKQLPLVTAIFIANYGTQAVAAETSATKNNASQLETLVVVGHRLNQLGKKLSAAEGTIGSAEIANRPVLRTGEILELVPGMVVTQHSGSGKANQFFLRGFNLDHGTDFNTSIDGMPVNMRTHGHGQGYTDLNFIIPELVGSIDYRKGAYYAEVGDFSGAGAASFNFKNSLGENLISTTLGEHNYSRVFTAGEIQLNTGLVLLGFERQVSDGPWTDIKEDIDKFNFNARYVRPIADGTFSLTAMAYDNSWNSPDQIPARAVEQGFIDNFGSLNTTNGGESSRYSLSGNWRTENWKANLYAINSDLILISDFTYFLDDPINGDQYQQVDDRTIIGGATSRQWDGKLFGTDVTHKVGGEFRYDNIAKVGLYKTKAREWLSTVREDGVKEASGGLFSQTSFALSDSLNTHFGLRYDYFHVDVDSNIEPNSGAADKGKLSLKAGATYLFNENIEAFINVGQGFHSNDARGATLKIDPVTLESADAVELIVPSTGAEIGLKIFDAKRFNISASLWYLESESELIFIGDAGHNEASRASDRIGAEIASYFWFDNKWSLDIELAWTRARFSENTQEEGKYVDGSVPFVASTGISYGGQGNGLHSSLRYRYFGARVLESFNEIKAGSTNTVNFGIGYQWDRINIELELYNLLDSDDHDIDYYYTSRLIGEPEGGVEDLHYHPAEPRTLRARAEYRF